jgi:hypothetical protein
VAAKIADVIYNPALDGIVDRFEIERIEKANDGQSEQVTIDAQVRRAGEQAMPKRMVATLRRDDGRWVISSLAGAR